MHNFEEAEASVIGFIESTSPEVISRSPYTIDELQKLINYKAPEGKEPYWVVPLIKILTMTGKRIGEVLGLTNDKINHEDMTIEISQMVTNGIYKKRLKGKGKPHKLKMDSELSDTIKELQELNNQRCPGSPWLFPPRQYRWVGDFPKKDNCPYKGRPIRRSSVDKFLKLRMIAAGVRIINIHGFRKTYATLRAVHLLSSGHRFARDVIRKELNHTRASTTDLYIDIAETYLEESKRVNVLSPLSRTSSEETKVSVKDYFKDIGIDVEKYDWDMFKEILSTVAKLSKKAS
jgi:integrase